MLTTQQSVALCNEIDAASSLFRHGFSVLDRYRSQVMDVEAVFVCLAGGTEKLLKLTVGVIAVEDGEDWPNRATMKAKGHRIVELDSLVRAEIVARAERSSAPGLIAKLLGMTDRHAGINQILDTLERYAVDGRFYNLDLLGGVNDARESPQQLWAELETLILEANPEMYEGLVSNYDHVRAELNDIIAWCLGQWCELLTRAWITGVCGELARQWSPQLSLEHPPPNVRL
ncbi:MAG TPA: hypothetical protein VFG42_11345 [Baekduia sp.]|uniref:hypothetical protein n=1 Tax=Baekduia sp. TaxID=2600305 RepID=UPI002D76E7F6|nr:hypothetical protein [Baekduia sp.]HET6507372.1 hypothetical protein [Baekduia sp.]